MTEPSDRRNARSPMARLAILAAAVACLASAGCVQRRMTIRSNPPGAMVYVDDHPIGITPVSHSFTYYGTREIRLVKDGYETLTVMQEFPAPWYQYPPMDFITENLVPGEIRDQRDLCFTLAPQAVVPPELLLGRAEELRRGVHAASGTAPPSIRIGPPPSGPSAPSAGPEFVPAPSPGFGGQPVYPVQPR